MSKYTEAEVLNAIKTMGLFRTSYPKDVVEKVVNNVLQTDIRGDTGIRGTERSCDNCKWQGADCWKAPVGQKCNDCNQWCERGEAE